MNVKVGGLFVASCKVEQEFMAANKVGLWSIHNTVHIEAFPAFRTRTSCLVMFPNYTHVYWKDQLTSINSHRAHHHVHLGVSPPLLPDVSRLHASQCLSGQPAFGEPPATCQPSLALVLQPQGHVVQVSGGGE